jgi:hypothetical protein
MTMPRIHVGAPINRGALTLFPLWTEHPESDGGYVTGAAAEAAKTLIVDELDQAAVPHLLAKNSGGAPVLLLEGEVLAGGLQTRVLNLSILVPAMHDLPVPVACVEAGRWGDRRQSRRGAVHSPPTLRQRKTASVNRHKTTGQRHADQGAVWDSVATYEDQFAAPSATSSYADVVAHQRTNVTALTDDLAPLPGQRGVIVGVAGKPVALELFDSASTFAEYFDSLLAGYSVDALAAEPVPTSSAQARGFVRRMAKATWSFGDAVGLGREITIDGEDVTGSGLAWAEDRPPVHVAAFA